MALKQDIERLRRAPVFACLEPEAIKLVAFSAVARRLPSGHVLFRRGEAAEAAVLLAAGTLLLDGERGDGAPARRASAETLLNEAALFAAGTQVETAVAETDCTVVAVPRNLMARVLELHPENAVALRRYWAERLRARLVAFRRAAPP